MGEGEGVLRRGVRVLAAGGGRSRTRARRSATSARIAGVTRFPASPRDTWATASRVLDTVESTRVASRAAMGRLGDRASRVHWIAADVTRFRPDRAFDVWHDRALFHFLVDPRDREAYRSAMGAAVSPSGQVIIGTFALDGPERCSGLPVVRYDAGMLAAELGPGYRLLEKVAEDHATPKGKVQRFQFCRFERVG